MNIWLGCVRCTSQSRWHKYSIFTKVRANARKNKFENYKNSVTTQQRRISQSLTTMWCVSSLLATIFLVRNFLFLLSHWKHITQPFDEPMIGFQDFYPKWTLINFVSKSFNCLKVRNVSSISVDRKTGSIQRLQSQSKTSTMFFLIPKFITSSC